jgi:hypothetical protein
MRKTLLVIAFLACAVGSAAGGAVAPRSPGGPATDYASLVRGLRAAGATTVAAGSVSQLFFSTAGQIVAINGAQAQVFEYRDAATAATQAARISSDGATIDHATQVDWIAPPHFYESGKLLVIYVGTNATVMRLLAAQLGPQFAGA